MAAALLPPGTAFVVPPTGNKKYSALVPIGGVWHRVPFGDRRYGQYRDSTPGRAWAALDHGDPERRAAYRRRHAGILCAGRRCIDIPYSPAWFSYHFLW